MWSCYWTHFKTSNVNRVNCEKEARACVVEKNSQIMDWRVCVNGISRESRIFRQCFVYLPSHNTLGFVAQKKTKMKKNLHSKHDRIEEVNNRKIHFYVLNNHSFLSFIFNALSFRTDLLPFIYVLFKLKANIFLTLWLKIELIFLFALFNLSQSFLTDWLPWLIHSGEGKKNKAVRVAAIIKY